MSLISVEAQNASLAMSYGPDKGSLAPATIEVAFFDGDPRDSGTELTATGGYAAAVVDNDGTTWPDAPADGEILSASISFGTSTGPWSATALWWLIRDAVTGDWWDSMPLPGDGLTVSAAGTPVSIRIAVNYNSTEATP